MTKHLPFILCVVATLILMAGTAMADSIKGRVGLTGRVGFAIPADSDINGVKVDTETGFIGGGGIIYGITDNIATELDVTHASYGSGTIVAPAPFGGSDFDTTNISLGVQYRFTNLPISKLVPYVGGGLDILVNDASTGGISDIDTVVGGHLSGGVDYFLLKELALTTEVKGVLAPDADIHNSGGAKIGNFDPNNFSMTFGVRYFFN
ncbi:MAG TPA: outer membrane beta-barrel protein [Geobacteraceae bacterium]|nr:outer membrane beta-barrel protein [Geobacteraceae bacterium]